jgi:hypothetical protein
MRSFFILSFDECVRGRERQVGEPLRRSEEAFVRLADVYLRVTSTPMSTPRPNAIPKV